MNIHLQNATNVINCIFLIISSVVIIFGIYYWSRCFYLKYKIWKLKDKYRELFLDLYGETLELNNEIKSIWGESLTEQDNIHIKYNFIQIINLKIIRNFYNNKIATLESIFSSINANLDHKVNSIYKIYFDSINGNDGEPDAPFMWKIYKIDYLNNSIVFAKGGGVKMFKKPDGSLGYDNNYTFKSINFPSRCFVCKLMKNKKKWSNRLPSYYLVEKINTFKDDQIIHFDLNDKQDETFMNDAIRWLKIIGIIKQ